MGICQYRHPLRQVSAAGRGHHHRGEVQRRGPGASLDGRLPDGGAARAVGSAQRRRRRGRGASHWRGKTGCGPEPSIPTCFRTRSTSTDRWRNPDAERAQRGAGSHPDQRRNRASAWAAAIFRCGSPTGRTIPARRTSGSAAWFAEGLHATHERMAPSQRMLVEYKPFEPAFYHTDIADWGMALLFAQVGGPERAGAGGHRPPLPGAEYRADCGVAAGSGHAGRIPLQRPPVRRRRSDDGVHRSLSGVPHLPRDPVLRMGDREARGHRAT